MDDLIQGILQYASVDKIDNTEKKIDLNVLVRDVLDTVYHPSNITISIQENLPIINGDDFRLKQLFQNLLSNAIKYCNQIKGDVALNYISKDNFWQFEITDNGMGIDAKYYKKIFQIFQVLEDSENSTGVGLSIVKKIVEFYGGKIWVTSKLKKGTTFYFTLPK
ncbi:MAG: HAMP domain-containing sensor histidine kinase [Polaribacter sp.]|nr:HAMP domain-containing sensor histidine kinase [Polaribacter sp.]MDG1993597.1 HAMP domain-containing sensor histidine kinase [Polaribacter sp.]